MTTHHRLSPGFPIAPRSVGRLGIRRPVSWTARPVAPGRASLAELGAMFDPDDVLWSLSRWGWTMVAYGDRHAPDPLVAYYQMDDYVDVFATRGLAWCGAYRARIWPDQDPVSSASPGPKSATCTPSYGGCSTCAPLNAAGPTMTSLPGCARCYPIPPNAATPSARPNSHTKTLHSPPDSHHTPK